MKLRLFALIVSLSLIAWAQQTPTPSTNSTSAPDSRSCCHHSADGKDVKACCGNARAEAGCCGKDKCQMKENKSCCGQYKDMEACAKHGKENDSCGKDCCTNGKAEKTATVGCCGSNTCERHPQTANG